ncbi:MAG TPA: presqualene diphosphate synthase HpnD [Rhizomicrobium sp.]|nr:presqualene diphosphate synthase HpnD [Rhizomicrobium sp.]
MLEQESQFRTTRPVDLRAVEEKASRSSFYTAMRLMAKPEREAMFAIYAFCRAVDDIADDGNGTRNERLAVLDEWRASIEGLYRGERPDLTRFLEDSVARYRLEKADFLAVIDGMQMDVDDDIRAPNLATLDLYCDRVASAVGRLSVHVFGMERGPGLALAHHLGRALQLTNIVRDIDEDAAIGRLYLPREYLVQAGVAARKPCEAVSDPRIDKACHAVAALAHEHYRAAGQVLAQNPKGHLRAPRLMHAVYSAILGKMEAQGWRPPRQRAKLGKAELLFILLRHGLNG